MRSARTIPHVHYVDTSIQLFSYLFIIIQQCAKLHTHHMPNCTHHKSVDALMPTSDTRISSNFDECCIYKPPIKIQSTSVSLKKLYKLWKIDWWCHIVVWCYVVFFAWGWVLCCVIDLILPSLLLQCCFSAWYSQIYSLALFENFLMQSAAKTSIDRHLLTVSLNPCFFLFCSIESSRKKSLHNPRSILSLHLPIHNGILGFGQLRCPCFAPWTIEVTPLPWSQCNLQAGVWGSFLVGGYWRHLSCHWWCIGWASFCQWNHIPTKFTASPLVSLLSPWWFLMSLLQLEFLSS